MRRLDFIYNFKSFTDWILDANTKTKGFLTTYESIKINFKFGYVRVIKIK